MHTIKQNIGHSNISLERAKAEAGDPREFVKGKRGDADIKVVLISRPYADDKVKQGTFYLKRK
jgi:hypothetical protein